MKEVIQGFGKFTLVSPYVKMNIKMNEDFDRKYKKENEWGSRICKK